MAISRTTKEKRKMAVKIDIGIPEKQRKEIAEGL